MSKPSLASSILRDAARTVLGPIGLRQKGRSRLWIGDHDWWLVLVEFQPSGWGPGSYLNVAPMWLWSPADSFHFDGPASRLRSFVECREGTFDAAALALAHAAKSRVEELRARFSSPEAVDEQLRTTSYEASGWAGFDAAVAAALAGHGSRAREGFGAIATVDRTNDSAWSRSLGREAAELRDLCTDAPAFRARVWEAVAESRRVLKLPPSSASPWSGR